MGSIKISELLGQGDFLQAEVMPLTANLPTKACQVWAEVLQLPPAPALPLTNSKATPPGFYCARDENPPSRCFSKKFKVPVNPLGRWKRKGKSGHFLNRADSSNTLTGRFLAFQPTSTCSVKAGLTSSCKEKGRFCALRELSAPKSFQELVTAFPVHYAPLCRCLKADVIHIKSNCEGLSVVRSKVL